MTIFVSCLHDAIREVYISPIGDKFEQKITFCSGKVSQVIHLTHSALHATHVSFATLFQATVCLYKYKDSKLQYVCVSTKTQVGYRKKHTGTKLYPTSRINYVQFHQPNDF